MSIYVGGLSTEQTLSNIKSQFIYDTKTDSDGGAWRYRCQHTSWYNESSSSTRSDKSMFPEVALLVTTNHDFYIYDMDRHKDGTDELELWMKFEGGGSTNAIWHDSTSTIKVYDAKAKNGHIALALGKNDNESYTGYYIINMVSEHIERLRSTTSYRKWTAGLKYRNAASNTKAEYSNAYNISSDVHGTHTNSNTTNSTTVEPHIHHDAKTDPYTRTLIPTWAIGMGRPDQINSAGPVGGVLIIHGNGNRYFKEMTQNWTPYEGLCWTRQGHLAIVRDNYDYVAVDDVDQNRTGQHPSGWLGIAHYRAHATNGAGINWPQPMIARLASNGEIDSPAQNMATKGIYSLHKSNELILWSNETGITKWWTETSWSAANQLAAYITTKFNTGWVFGKTDAIHLCSTETDTIGPGGTNRINNGTFASNVSGWYGDSGASVTHSTDDGGIARVTNGGGDNTFAIAQASVFQTEQPDYGGQRYRIQGRVKATFSGAYTFRVRAGGNSVSWSITTGLTSGSWVNFDTGIVTADGHVLEIGSNGGGITAFDIDDIVVSQLSEPDRSMCNRPLRTTEVSGSANITRTPVATGAELVSFGNFSSVNCLRTDYTANYNFTNEFTIMFWVKDWAASTSLAHLGPYTTRASKTSFHLYCDGGEGYRLTLTSNGSSEQIFEIDNVDAPKGWQHVCFTLNGSTVVAYLNGEKAPFTGDTASSFTGGNIFSQATDQNPLYIGDGPVGNHFSGQVALFKLSRENIYANEVRKVYKDELKMFQENAKVTIDSSNTNDQINAGCVDQVRNTLIVGTTSHRSEFQGLVRINSKTPGVATLNTLSACDGKVAYE